MNEEDIWIITYMTMLWKTGDTDVAKVAATRALRDYKKEFANKK